MSENGYETTQTHPTPATAIMTQMGLKSKRTYCLFQRTSKMVYMNAANTLSTAPLV